MECKKMPILIHKHADGKLTKDEERILREHLTKCSLCRDRFNYLEKIEILLKTEKVEAPADFTQKILDRLPGEEPTLRPVRTRFLFYPQWRWVPVLGLVAILMITSLVLVTRKPVSSLVIVTFRIELPEAQAVSLVGDFNGWDVTACRLTREDDTWMVKLPLPPGRYQYMFVADGSKWVPDPKAGDYVDNGYGGKNSVIDTTRL